MDRTIIYPGAIPLDTDLLNTQVNAMVGLGFLARAALGTTTSVDGLALSQSGPASMVINVGQGSITQVSTVDGSAFGSLGTSSDPLIKVGINRTSTPLTLAAPGTAGTSINYLIQATLAEADDLATVLSYYNSSNPLIPFSGPGNAGTSQNTRRKQTVTIGLLAGAAATTGTQTTPAVTAGYVPLYVVTVAFGQTTITSSSWVIAPSAPFVDPGGIGLGTRFGRLVGVQSWGGPAGTFTYTRSNGARLGLLYMVGGGGGGGGAPVTGASQYSCGAGGGSGAYLYKQIAALPQTATVVLGAGGASNTGLAGGNGGTTSWAATYTAAGGIGGLTAGPSAGGFLAMPGGGGTKGSTGDIEFSGNPGAPGLAIGTTTVGGTGGASQMASGAGFGSGGSAGGNATNSAGSGGGGGSIGPSTAAVAGGGGAPGFVLLLEYT